MTQTAYAPGVMFWFTRKKFVGSYFFLMSADDSFGHLVTRLLDLSFQPVGLTSEHADPPAVRESPSLLVSTLLSQRGRGGGARTGA